MKKILLFTAALLLSLSLGAQELANFVGTGSTASPEFKDGKITFRLAASYATRVQITGGFMPTQKVVANGRENEVPITADMTRNAQGVWEYTIDMPAPELYITIWTSAKVNGCIFNHCFSAKVHLDVVSRICFLTGIIFCIHVSI